MVVLSDSNCIALHSQSIVKIKTENFTFSSVYLVHLNVSRFSLLDVSVVVLLVLFVFEEIPAFLFTSSPKREHVALYVGHPCIANYLSYMAIMEINKL